MLPPLFQETLQKRPVHPHGPFFVCRIDAGRGGLPGRTLSVSLRSTAVPLFVACRERDASGTNPLSRLRRQLSRRESPWQKGQLSSLFVNGRKKPAVKQQTFRLCQSLSLSGEVARRSRDGEGCFRDEPSQSPTATALPKGEPLAEPASFVLTGQRQEEACR